MKLKCLGCEALARIIYLCAAQSPHIVDVELFRLGLHNDPSNLRDLLQGRIDATSADEYDAIALAYGLCGQATAGLTAGKIPLVVPRAHDCITLFLGDRARYRDQFYDHPGTYWYALDYKERIDSSGTSFALGAETEKNKDQVYAEYVEKYGVRNADYLMEVMGAWQSHYQRAVFIDMDIGDATAVEAQARNEATEHGWKFERIAGDLVLIRRLLTGDWETDYLFLQPGEQIAATFNDDVVRCLAHHPESEKL